MNVQDAGLATVHELLWYVPDKVPFAHVLCWLTHCWPEATDDAWYAVTVAPLATVWLFHVQALAVPTTQDALV